MKIYGMFLFTFMILCLQVVLLLPFCLCLSMIVGITDEIISIKAIKKWIYVWKVSKLLILSDHKGTLECMEVPGTPNVIIWGPKTPKNDPFFTQKRPFSPFSDFFCLFRGFKITQNDLQHRSDPQRRVDGPFRSIPEQFLNHLGPQKTQKRTRFHISSQISSQNFWSNFFLGIDYSVNTVDFMVNL